MASLKAIQQLALSKALGEDDLNRVRDRVTSDRKYEIDFVCRVHGTMKINKDYEASPTARAMSFESVALALRHTGCLRDRAEQAIIAAMERTGELDDEARIYVDGIKAALKRRFDAMPKEPRRGAVHAQLWVERVSSKSEFDDAPAESEVFEGRVVDSVKETVGQ